MNLESCSQWICVMLLWAVNVKFCDKITTLEEIPLCLWKKLLYTSLLTPHNQQPKKYKTNKKNSLKHPTKYPDKKHPKKATPQSQLTSGNMTVHQSTFWENWLYFSSILRNREKISYWFWKLHYFSLFSFWLASPISGRRQHIEITDFRHRVCST